MVYREHLCELYINKEKVELESQKSLNLRFNNVLTDPTKITSTNAEYSFEFEIPSTPKNDRIFDFANNLSKLNKFHTRWNAELYVDGNIIFEGSLTLNSYKDKKYKANLVSVKNYSLDDIFGDSMMTDIPWYIPFEGSGESGTTYTIDWYNTQNHKDVSFPLISYGVFTKDPNEYGEYKSSKFDMDKYNRWYVESFYPSINMVETLRKAFEWKEYTVDGDVFKDTYLKDIFMSVNLADGQSPTYNLGNPKFGKVDLSIYWQNPMDTSNTNYGTVQTLKYPYYPVYMVSTVGHMSGGRITNKSVMQEYNLTEVKVYNLLSSNDGGNVSINGNTNLFSEGETQIVIPADGFYKIYLSGSTQLTTSSNIRAMQIVHEDNTGWIEAEEKQITMAPDYRVTTPLEIQLVKNYDEDLELIKGKNNLKILDGYPDHQTTTMVNGNPRNNLNNYYTCFPHEKLGVYFDLNVPPTDLNDLSPNLSEDPNVGYVYMDGSTMAYDPCVSPKFICGFTSMGNKLGGGCAAVIKNGYSWSKTVADEYYSIYNSMQYLSVSADTIRFVSDSTCNYSTHATEGYNENLYQQAPDMYTQGTNDSFAKICCVVYLKKDDRLSLLGVHRNYTTSGGSSVTYQTVGEFNLSIEAYSPKSYYDVKKNVTFNSPSEFDTNLRLSNFFNKEKKISEWIQNVADAFNLEILQNGKNVTINTKKKLENSFITAVDVDDRVNSNEAESQIIDYPKSMAVKYKINGDEWGFERSAVENAGGEESVLNDPDWQKYADSGYTEIMLNDDSYVTTKSEKQLQFSYTWYDSFNWYEVDYNGQQNPYRDPVLLRLPCISKFSYMIDGYNYEESMKHDGYGLAQRFWYRPRPTECYVWTETYPKRSVQIYVPSNISNDGNLNLSYKNTEKSILTKYFNINAYLASNYVEIDVYLTPVEYNRLKNGALVHFESDLYYVISIDGYDPTDNDPTTLKLMKKTV